MGHEHTPEEVKADIVSKMPAGTGRLFYELDNSVSNLHLVWKNYRILYGTSPERIDLLNWSASTFFGLLDDILRSEVFMGIARLADPKQSVGKDTVSLERLISDLKNHLDQNTYDKLVIMLNEFKLYCDPIKQLRNRTIAHEDLATALKYHPDPLPGISRAFIEGALLRIRNILNDIEFKFLGNTTYYQDIISQHDAESLIFALEGAKEHEKCRKEQFMKKYRIPFDNNK